MVQVKGRKLSRISAKHYAELVFRALLFLGACLVYATDLVRDPEQLFGDIRHIHPLLWVVKLELKQFILHLIILMIIMILL